MPEEDFLIETPDNLRVMVGESETVPVLIKNICGFRVESITVTSKVPDSGLSGDIPETLDNDVSFKMELTVSPKEWRDDGIKGIISVEAVKVSR